MHLISVLFCFVLLLCSCATFNTLSNEIPFSKPASSIDQKEKWELMIGTWYGEHPLKDGAKKQWIVVRKENGKYIITFRESKPDGSISDTVEVGQWAVSGPVYFSSFRGHVIDNKIYTVDPSYPYNYDAYEILHLDKELFKYRHFEVGATYTIRRVNDDFQFPE